MLFLWLTNFTPLKNTTDDQWATPFDSSSSLLVFNPRLSNQLFQKLNTKRLTLMYFYVTRFLNITLTSVQKNVLYSSRLETINNVVPP